MPYPNSEVCDCVSVCILNQILHVSVVNVAVAPKISGLYPKHVLVLSSCGRKLSPANLSEHCGLHVAIYVCTDLCVCVCMCVVGRTDPRLNPRGAQCMAPPRSW